MPTDISSETADKLKLKGMEPEDFWIEMNTLKNYLDMPMFPNLVKVGI